MNSAAPTTRQMLRRRQRLLGTPYRLFYTDPVELVRGEGVWLYDRDGNRYLDAYNNVPCVGHSHPRVVEAVGHQMALLNTHTRYLSRVTLDYAEHLLATFDGHFGRVMFTCSGSEANDLALRIARHWTGNAGVIVSAHAYHGTTTATARVSPSLDAAAADAVEVELVDPPPCHNDRLEDVDAFGRRVRAAIAALATRGIRPAALLVDSVMSSDGLVPMPTGFLRAAASAIREAGGLYIADEVQAGFGRTGLMWGFKRHGVSPDIVTLGKPMGNGYPLAGLVAHPELVDSFGKHERYFNTFAGTPVACAAGQAVLDVLAEEDLVVRAADTGVALLARLEGLRRLPTVRDVRGVGLFVAVEIEDQTRSGGLTATAVVDHMRAHGVLAGVTGPASRIVKIRPPLAFTDDKIAPLAEAIERGLACADRCR